MNCLERHINYIVLIKKDFSLGRNLIPIPWFIIMSLENYLNFGSHFFHN